MERKNVRTNHRVLWLIFSVFSLLGFVVLLAQIYYSKGGTLRGAPILLWDTPVNILLAPAAIYSFVIISGLILIPRTFTDAASKARQRFIRIVLGVALLVSAVAIAGIMVNMDRYGIVPSTQENASCKIIYSWGNSAMYHRFGEFYIASDNFHLAHRTPYSWASKGSGPVPADAWEIEWEDAIGKLEIKSDLSVDPDDTLPARFNCPP